jgi:SpoIID/LytB domain protein
MTHTEPLVHVGILFEPQIEFVLYTPFRLSPTGEEVRGKQVVTYDDGRILWNGRHYNELQFQPIDEAAAYFELLDVTIGINFHWERKEDQRFVGALKIIVEDGKLTAVNVIRTEEYLTSVISSEMSATSSPELLKAHAIISRSWLLSCLTPKDATVSEKAAKSEGLVWYERDAHTRFDVCADDHCQRYQGITRASTPAVREAIAATRGQVLTYDGQICDARFYKSCGGVLEEFQYAWADTKYPYLKGKRDSLTDTKLPDLTQEAEAEKWIRSSPEAFCNTADKEVLSQVLNDYDQETTHFYRWTKSYGQAELSALIRERSGIDYGDIIDLVPVARGTSGRLWKLKIVGTKETRIIGKELEIRRTLSTSHLYSSAFVVDKEGTDAAGLPARFTLTGAGWGHGVGLCQIGAAVMAARGHGYEEILLHYYTDATIDKLYN